MLERIGSQLRPCSYIQIPCGVTFFKRNRSEKEVRAAALVLQTIWGYKELRKPLEKEGWKKSDFQVGKLLGLRHLSFFFFFLVSGNASVFGFFYFTLNSTFDPSLW